MYELTFGVMKFGIGNLLSDFLLKIKILHIYPRDIAIPVCDNLDTSLITIKPRNMKMAEIILPKIKRKIIAAFQMFNS